MFLKNLRLYVVGFLIGMLPYFSALSADNIEEEGKWNKPGIPHKGWSHVAVQDLEDTTGVCEMCDKTRIRYLHTVSHDAYKDLVVGRVCAEKMCEDYINPKNRETQSKKEAKRRENQARIEAERIEAIKRSWLSLVKWRSTHKGGYSRMVKPNEWINIFQRNGCWNYVYQNNFSNPYRTVEEAIQASYDQYKNNL